MSETYSPSEIEERFGALPYVTPYSRIIALVDRGGRAVELHEFHARDRCTGGAAWEVYHYARTSPLVLSARREGARNVFVCRTGRAELDLVPGIAGAGLEEVRVEAGEVLLTYAGLAGGGIAATLCRGMAGNVISTEVHERGGGAELGRATLRLPATRRLAIGVDDTDDAERGATWSLVNEIAFALEAEGEASYLLHTIAQLYPDNPYKTTNCCATAVTLGVPGESLAVVRRAVREELESSTFSDECGMAWSEEVLVPAPLSRFAERARRGMVTVEEARRVAGEGGAGLEPVTGERGCIGALAALGTAGDPDGAVTTPGAEG